MRNGPGATGDSGPEAGPRPGWSREGACSSLHSARSSSHELLDFCGVVNTLVFSDVVQNFKPVLVLSSQ